MATYTEQYGLHQWEPQDDFLRSDFNTDFQKIDTALGEKGNCILESGRYVGTGTYDVTRPTSLELGFRPKLLMIQEEAESSCRSVVVLGDCDYSYMRSAGSSGGCTLTWTWSGTGVSWYANGGFADDQLNENGIAYRYVALG